MYDEVIVRLGPQRHKTKNHNFHPSEPYLQSSGFRKETFCFTKMCHHVTDQRKTINGKKVKLLIAVFPRTIPKTSLYFLEKMPAVTQLARKTSIQLFMQLKSFIRHFKIWEFYHHHYYRNKRDDGQCNFCTDS